MADRMPERSTVHPDFDGHLERRFVDLSPEEKLAWLWETQQLLEAGQAARRARARDQTTLNHPSTAPRRSPRPS